MRQFDAKFGASFLAGVPNEPGVYRFFDAAGALLYVGKSTNLRRRLGQYRNAGRGRRDRKQRALIKAAARIAWEVVESPLAAELAELGLIQTLRPRRNVAGAYSFLYPYLGLRSEADETYFCLTTSPDAFGAFALHGAFRSRERTVEAFYALARLLRFVGHPVPAHRCRRLGSAPHSRVLGFRRLPADTHSAWGRLLSGESRAALEELVLLLVEHAAARARPAEIQADLDALACFYGEEAVPLARARRATGYAPYPVPQLARDQLFATYRHVTATAATRAASRKRRSRARVTSASKASSTST